VQYLDGYGRAIETETEGSAGGLPLSRETGESIVECTPLLRHARPVAGKDGRRFEMRFSLSALNPRAPIIRRLTNADANAASTARPIGGDCREDSAARGLLKWRRCRSRAPFIHEPLAVEPAPLPVTMVAPLPRRKWQHHGLYDERRNAQLRR
jgi:hypothetical protein